MRQYHVRLLMFALVMMLVVPATAQDAPADENRLLAALALVPDTPAAHAELYYNDRFAITQAYPTATIPSDFEAFQNRVLRGNSPAFLRLGPSVWWSVYVDNVTDPLGEQLMVSQEMPDVVGFDYFDVTTTIAYGTPPDDGLILLGEFDTDAIGAAFSELDYTEAEPGVWCGPGGCEDGTSIDFEQRNPANPFGGMLGRSQPVVVTPDRLMSAAVFDLVTDHQATTDGGASLADNPDVAAAVGAIGNDGPVIQASIFSGANLEALQEVPDIYRDIRTSLPPYTLLMFVDTVIDEAQVGAAVLVYDNEADATAAADELVVNLAQRDIQTLQQLTERGLNPPTVAVVPGEERYAVVIAFSGPLPSVDQLLAGVESNDDDATIRPGAAYRMLFDSFIRLDMPWLATQPTG